MLLLRSALFNLFFFVSTFVLTLSATVASLVAPAEVMSWAKYWARLQIHALRIICGIRLEISGWDNLPDAPVLIACRHESTFDILVWLALLPAACFVVKRELTRIPLFGRCIRTTGMIIVDREAGGSAMRTLLRDGGRAALGGRHIIIFPEGTRVGPNEHPPLQAGVAALASAMKLLVVPVMLDSGTLWGRRSFGKQPGTIRIVIERPLIAMQRRAVLNALRAAYGG